MVTIEQVRQLALSLPESTEQPHHDLGSFRVRGKIFATVPDDDHVRIMLDEPEILAVAQESPESCHEFYWGKKLSCLLVDLDGVSVPQVREWLTDAWLRKAPTTLAKQLGQGLSTADARGGAPRGQLAFIPNSPRDRSTRFQ